MVGKLAGNAVHDFVIPQAQLPPVVGKPFAAHSLSVTEAVSEQTFCTLFDVSKFEVGVVQVRVWLMPAKCREDFRIGHSEL